VSNRSEISGHKPQNGQNIRTGKPAVKSPGQIDTVKDMREVIKTPEQLDEHIRQTELEKLDEAHYAEQGKVPPPAQGEVLEGDAVALEHLRGRANDLKDLAKTIDPERIPIVSIDDEEKVNHRSGPSYLDLKAMYEEEKAKAEAAGELLNKARIIINNPFHRYGQFVDSVPLGEALGMKKVWQPKESR
jgi:hypothetical protein